MSSPTNFYTTGGTLLPSAKSYVTRRADHDLLQYLLQGEFCFVLTSRQMGKSSIMVRTAGALRAAGVKVAILDLTRIGQNLSPEQWYDGLLLRLGSELDLEDELEEYWIDERVARLGPMQRFMSAIREIALPALKGNLAIFIDEIDSVRSLPFSSDEFFAGIRECYNSRVGDEQFKRISFCLLGVAQPSDLITNVNITPFNIGRRIELTDFTEAEATPLLEGLLSHAKTPKAAEALLARVIYWTGGHPYLTQRLCDALGRHEGLLQTRDVDAACEEMFLSSRSREKEDNLIFVRDRVLSSKEHRSSILDLYAKVRRGERVRDDDSNTILDPLRLSGLVIVSNGYLKVRNRIYATVFDREWIVKSMPDAELRRQKAAYWRGILFALGISLPVLAVIIALGLFAIGIEHKSVRDNFFSDTVAAQDAFNAGDYVTAKKIVDEWTPSKANHWWQKMTDWAEGGRHEFTVSFPARLLRAERPGESTGKFTWPAFTPAPFPLDEIPQMPPCDATNTVATVTDNQGRPLVAFAGEDSSVQVWDLKNKVPVAHLQLTSTKGEIAFHSDLVSCQDYRNGVYENQDVDFPGIHALRFSPDGTHLALGTGTWSNGRSPGVILLWDFAKPEGPMSLGRFTQPYDSSEAVDSFDWVGSPTGTSYLAASSEDITAKVWKFSGNVVTGTATIDPRKVLSAAAVGGSGANAIALSDGNDQDHRHLMAIGYGDGRLILYDYEHLHFDSRSDGGQDRHQNDEDKPVYTGIAHISGIMSMTFIRQRDNVLRLVIGSRDGDMLLLDLKVLLEAYSKAITLKLAGIDPKSAATATRLVLHPDQGVLQGLTATYICPDADPQCKDPDAWLLISGSNGTAALWAITPSFHLVSTLHGHMNGINAAAFCPPAPGFPADCLLTASEDKTIRLWHHPFRDREDHRGISGLTFPGQVIGLRFTADPNGGTGRRLVVGMGTTTDENRDHAGTIAAWDYAHSKLRPLESSSGKAIAGFGVSPDGRLAVSSSRGSRLSVLDLQHGLSVDDTSQKRTDPHVTQALPIDILLQPKILVRCLSADGAAILEVCKADQADYLVMGVANTSNNVQSKESSAQGLCKWHIRDAGMAATPRFSVVQPMLNPCQSPEVPAASRGSGVGKFVDIAHRINVFDITPKGELLATAAQSADGRIQVEVWNTADFLKNQATYQETSPQKTASGSSSQGFDSSFADLAFSADGQHLAASTLDSLLYYWNVKDTPMEPRQNLNPTASAVQDDRIPLPARGQILAFSPDGRYLAIGIADAGIALWSTENLGSSDLRWHPFHRLDTANYSPILTIRRHSGGIQGLAFSPDGNGLASVGNDGRVRILKVCDPSSGDSCK